jgi:hypothetical protein
VLPDEARMQNINDQHIAPAVAREHGNNNDLGLRRRRQIIDVNIRHPDWAMSDNDGSSNDSHDEIEQKVDESMEEILPNLDNNIENENMAESINEPGDINGRNVAPTLLADNPNVLEERKEDVDLNGDERDDVGLHNGVAQLPNIPIEQIAPAPPLLPIPPNVPPRAGANANAAADVEIRVALHEMFGLRGPISSIVRSSFCLILFNFVFIVMCIFAPSSLGSFVHKILYSLTKKISFDVPSEWSSLVSLIGSYMSLIVKYVIHQSSVSTKLLRISDLCNVYSGYLFMVISIFILNFILQWHHRRFGGNAGTQSQLAKTVELLSSVVKIMWLLGFRIFCLPCLMGT